MFELDLVAVAGGTLRAGSSIEEVKTVWQAHDDLGLPWHYFAKETGSMTVVIANLEIQRCPMTWAELHELLPDVVERLRTPDESWRHPVDRIPWETAQRAAQRAAERTGLALRLPGEWEWEWIARGDDDREYPWGDRWDPSCTNTAEGQRGGTLPVGSFPAGASEHGVLDLAGNIDEWTATIYAPLPGAHWTVPAKESWAADPHVTRGGSWQHHRDTARTRRRHGLYRPWVGSGFRLVRDLL